MNPWSLFSVFVKVGGGLLLVAGVTSAVVMLCIKEQGFARLKWLAYEEFMRAQFRYLFWPIRGEVFARFQLVLGAGGTIALVLTQGFSFALETLLGWAPVVVLHALLWLAPLGWLKWRRKKRIEALEEQAHKWLQILADNLRVNSALGYAIEGTSHRLKPPMSQEVGLVIKELQLGRPVDDALKAAASRVKNHTFTSATLAMVIANRRGGDLPSILAQSAADVREALRLDRMFRGQTADARMELITAGATMPLLFAGMLWYLPKLARLMFQSESGMTYFTVSVVIWVVALVRARAILQVKL